MTDNSPDVSDVVFNTRMELKVFQNNGGSITIEQADYMGNESSIIVIESSDIELVIKALRKAKRDTK